MLNSDMDDKLAAEPTDSHGLDVGVGNFSFDSTEQIYKGRELEVVKVTISEEEDSLLAFVDMVDFIEFDRQYDFFCY